MSEPTEPSAADKLVAYLIDARAEVNRRRVALANHELDLASQLDAIQSTVSAQSEMMGSPPYEPAPRYIVFVEHLVKTGEEI